MTDVFSDADRDACAREAAAAIEAILERRCPEMKAAFWSAVARLYRLDVRPGVRLPAAPGVTHDAEMSARSG